MKVRAVIAAGVLILLTPWQARAQKSEAWLDFVANWSPPASLWSYEVNPGFAKGLAGAQWLDVYVASTAAFQPHNWLSTEGNLEFHYTFDKVNEDVLEVRPWLGFNFIWATFGKYLNLFYPSVSLRLEERFFWYQESGTNETKTRARIRLFARFPLNNETLSPETFYILSLAEVYLPLDGEAPEVSADRKRFQLGLGYVAATDLRLELQFILMRTRNSIENTFETDSRIVWLLARHYL
jgi:hypothetical protein